MILFGRVYLNFRSDWPSDGGIYMAGGTLMPMRGLSPDDELPFFGYNVISFYAGRFNLSVCFKSAPKIGYHSFSWNSFKLMYYITMWKFWRKVDKLIGDKSETKQ